MTKLYLSFQREISIKNIRLIIPVGVFHPTLFSSTGILANYIESQQIINFRILELGAGSGLLSIIMAKRGAIVTASDISKRACSAVLENASINETIVEVIHSDLFDNFDRRHFDLIIINPPYYPKNPTTDAEKAWFCGIDFDYFRKLFNQLNAFIAKNGYAIMVLSEDCNIKKISQLATDTGYSWQHFFKIKRKGEWNYLFKIVPQIH